MRAVLILLAIVLVLAFVGWISFTKGTDRSSINIETNQIRHDTNEAVQSGAKLLHKAGDKMEQKSVPANEKAPLVPNESAPLPQ